MNIHRINIFMYIVVTFVAAFVACFTSSAVADEVTLQLKWKHQFQFAGYYAAIEKGFYRQAGLDVRLVEGGPDREATVEVASGRAQYGIANSQVLLKRINGEPLVVLAAIFQHSPLVIVSRKDKGISSPPDLVGKVVLMTRDSRDVELHAALMNEGISLDRVNIVDEWVRREDYFDPGIDAVSAYITNEVYYLIEQKIPYQIINPLIYGIDFYGDCLITSEQELSSKPERVKAFREASLKGWKYAMEHPDELIEIIQKKYPSDKSVQHLRYEAETMRDLVLPHLVEIGHMNPGRWEHIARTFARFGWGSADYSLDKFLYDPNPKMSVTQARRLVGIVSFLAVLAGLFGIIMFVFNRRLGLEVGERKVAEEALRESEERFRGIVDSMADWIWEIDSGGRYTYCSEKVEEILGYRPEEMLGESHWGFMAPGERDRLKGELTANLVERKPIKDMEKWMISRDGRKLCFRTSCVPVLGENGGLIGWLGVDGDITAQKQAEMERESLQVQLRHAQKMEAVGTLAGGVAHDFNNLLQAITGFTQILLFDKDETHKDFSNLKSIVKAVDRAAELVRQMLLFSRKTSTERKPINLNQQLNLAVQILERTIPKMIEIVVHQDARLWTVDADPVQVEQIFLNLGANAGDAMPDGGRLVFRTENLALNKEVVHDQGSIEPGKYVMLSVSDTGQGMDSETVDRIFEPFFTTKEVGKGTGLGLASVYGIVKNHGGDITCQSEIGKGTEFKVYFPAVKTGPDQATGGNASGVIPGGSERVLLVDDDPAVKEVACVTLENHGYAVETASSGEEAVSLFQDKKGEIDLILLDIGMPGMGGYKCLENLLRIDSAAKVVMVTGYSTQDAARSVEAGAIDYITKPYQLDELLINIRKYLDRPQTRDGRP